MVEGFGLGARLVALHSLAMNLSDSGAMGANRASRGEQGISDARHALGEMFEEMYDAARSLLRLQYAALDAARGYIAPMEPFAYYNPNLHRSPGGTWFGGWVRPDIRRISLRASTACLAVRSGAVRVGS